MKLKMLFMSKEKKIKYYKSEQKRVSGIMLHCIINLDSAYNSLIKDYNVAEYHIAKLEKKEPMYLVYR